jgi:hypothetical protein
MWEKELSLGKAGKDFWGKTASWTTERRRIHALRFARSSCPHPSRTFAETFRHRGDGVLLKAI